MPNAKGFFCIWHCWISFRSEIQSHPHTVTVSDCPGIYEWVKAFTWLPAPGPGAGLAEEGHSIIMMATSYIIVATFDFVKVCLCDTNKSDTK